MSLLTSRSHDEPLLTTARIGGNDCDRIRRRGLEYHNSRHRSADDDAAAAVELVRFGVDDEQRHPVAKWANAPNHLQPSHHINELVPLNRTPRIPRRKRINRSRNLNIPRHSAKQPQPSADIQWSILFSVCRTTWHASSSRLRQEHVRPTFGANYTGCRQRTVWNTRQWFLWCPKCIPLLALNRLLCDHRTLNFHTSHAYLILSRVQLHLGLSGTHCPLILGLLIAPVLLGLDLKLTYFQRPMSPSVSVTQRRWFGSRYWCF